MKRELRRKLKNEKFARYYNEYMMKYRIQVDAEMKDDLIFRIASVATQGFMLCWPMFLLFGTILSSVALLLFGVFAGLFSGFAMDILYETKKVEPQAQAYAEERMKGS